MILKYSSACFAIIGILVILKFCEGSPVRSWKSVFLTAFPLGFITCYYISCAFPPPPPRAPQAQKVSAYKAELERTFRRIAGVDRASINGSIVAINFAEDKPLSELKQIAVRASGTAASFLKLPQVTVNITIRGRERYQLDYNINGQIVERTF